MASGARDVLVVPSLNLDAQQIALVQGVHHYEERQLFELIRLRQPKARMVFVTSKLLPELVVDAVLELLPGVPISHARHRLKLFDTDDASPRPLAAKLLERPRLLQRIRQVLNRDRSYISCFNVGELERQLSETLQVPLLGTDPALAYWGSKAGSRELFSRCGLATRWFGVGAQLQRSGGSLRRTRRTPTRTAAAVVKLNEGFSGEGNAPRPLWPRARHGAGLRHQLSERLGRGHARWLARAAGEPRGLGGGLAQGRGTHSPSVQGMIHPGGVEVLSTHEQLLGGPSGQTYLGCQFPARDHYRGELQRWGLAVGS